jgi:hypothetical protein
LLIQNHDDTITAYSDPSIPATKRTNIMNLRLAFLASQLLDTIEPQLGKLYHSHSPEPLATAILIEY